jgi:hypothetical protein
MSFNNNPSVYGPGKARPFKTRTPVGKLKPKFTVPRAGRLNIPIFGKSPNPNGQTKANTPAFRGPAKLPTNFLKNFGTGNFKQSINPLAQKFNGPLRIPRLGLVKGEDSRPNLGDKLAQRKGPRKLLKSLTGFEPVPRLGHGKTVRRKVKKSSRKK